VTKQTPIDATTDGALSDTALDQVSGGTDAQVQAQKDIKTAEQMSNILKAQQDATKAIAGNIRG
jgi:hypothetical protein